MKKFAVRMLKEVPAHLVAHLTYDGLGRVIKLMTGWF